MSHSLLVDDLSKIDEIWWNLSRSPIHLDRRIAFLSPFWQADVLFHLVWWKFEQLIHFGLYLQRNTAFGFLYTIANVSSLTNKGETTAIIGTVYLTTTCRCVGNTIMGIGTGFAVTRISAGMCDFFIVIGVVCKFAAVVCTLTFICVIAFLAVTTVLHAEEKVPKECVHSA